jgi:serine/threonine-protein kinase RsbW
MRETVTVTIPPDPALLHVLRQMTVGVAARLRLTIDDVDDIKLAVDEAASALLMRLPGSSAIVLALDVDDDDTMRATVSSEVHATEWPTRPLLESLPWKVVTGLVDSATASRDAGGRPSIVLIKHAFPASDR